MEPVHPDYPLPDVDDPVMRPFWDGARDGRLMLQRETTTGRAVWPPKPMYWKGGGRLDWFQASGRGRIFSYVVAHAPFLPALEHLLPLVLILVEVEEGPRLVGYLVNGRPEDVRFEMPVRVVFRQLTERVALPVWEPAT
jgi:uncharacterized OB-fold protein